MPAQRLLQGLFALLFLAAPALGQVTVLDQAQDAGGAPEAAAAAPGAPCGNQPLTIVRMSWPSATLLAEIHSRILRAEFGCEVQVVPGDLAATASSMGSTGQPAVAPELWVNRIADVWNGAMDTQMVRSAAPTYAEPDFEGWFMPAYMGAGLPEVPTAATLVTVLPTLETEGQKLRFISCPIDWACSVINRNLITAQGIADLVEIVEPANRLEMDRLIAEAVNRREPFLFYYWQPNAVLAQLDFVGLDMGDYVEEAAQCLGTRDCANPEPSAFPQDMVVIALAERVFTNMPVIASYFQRTTMTLEDMNALLAQLSAEGATPEAVADRFVAERRALWGTWLDARN
ncbi:glycine betaine ABC transporter substrate-binding protein [Devosia rhizoryzae]|uniref:ABC-type glycine betaine transport system substrate-binding domain-containing protein n=1 Tax=Devosia rhizoryzae TaxID=2774137 RepID=A0ABX7C554_9HYPH|nr:glycine betaine ABC transporter substrate-binding protein [Devosia rhizoryzae]QQR39346.1 hypothetical protein JI748_16765 [Devosia rhizoryzae]